MLKLFYLFVFLFNIVVGDKSSSSSSSLFVSKLETKFSSSNVKNYFSTFQDHFDPTNDKTWYQAYYVNDTFWKGPESGSPVFVCVGGEGPPIDESVVSSSVHCNNVVEWLEETGGIMFAVEHRYYGCHNMSACPVDSLEDASAYRYLHSMQAVEDLALFHRHAVKKYGLIRDKNKFVLWGGSYPGMVAAFTRIKFPNLYYAAVASSAPVQAKLEMEGYFDVVSDAYASEIVGGSTLCRDIIAKGHAEIGEKLEKMKGREYLESLFGLPKHFLESQAHQIDFCSQGVANFPSQGNDPLCSQPVCNIQSICTFLVEKVEKQKEDPLSALAALRSLQQQQQQENFKKESYNFLSISQQMKKRKKRGDLKVDTWEWQVCSEFGFLQTCNTGSKCMFTQGLLTVDVAFEQACAPFGENNFSIKKTESLVEISNNRYGGNTTDDIERILWVNGSIDPWIALSVQNLTKFQKERDQKVILVEGASHHAWTHPSDPNDQPTVKNARLEIRKVVSNWLNEK